MESVGDKTERTPEAIGGPGQCGSHVNLLKMPRLPIQFPSSNGAVCTRHFIHRYNKIAAHLDQNSYPSAQPMCHSFLAATTTFDHGCEQSQTMETSRECPLLAGCGHQSLESLEGCLWHPTSPGGIWFRRYSSDDDQGTLSTLLR